jgi:hypothetical protein
MPARARVAGPVVVHALAARRVRADRVAHVPAADAARRVAIAKRLQPAGNDGLPAIESSVIDRHAGR